MGETTLTEQKYTIRRTVRTHSLHLQVDITLILAVISLLVIGLLAVYSASVNYTLRTSNPASYILNRQVLWVIVGIAFAVFFSFFDYHRFKRLALPILTVTLLLLLIVLFVDYNPYAPDRTLFEGSVQPSEMAKLVIVIYLSVWLNAKQDSLKKFFLGLLPMTLILGFTGGMIMIQPDVSASFTIFFLGGLLFFLAGGRFRQIVLLIILAGFLGLIVIIMSGRTDRITDYILGLQNPQMASYHVQRSLEAIIHGGWFGVGIGRATTKFTGLPVPWTDSIFAVIAEETGLIGASLVVSLYLLLLWRGLKIARHSQDLLGNLLAAGITLWISFEALINISVLINLAPFTGNALPLISAGGSSMIITMVGVGILLNVSRPRAPENNSKTEGRSVSAVVNLRGRDRRRRIPRRGSSTSARK